MERECNDYLQLTRKYLRNYCYYCEAIKNLTQELDDIQAGLRAVSIASPGFGAGGGRGDMTPTEREADLRIEQKNKYMELACERTTLKQQTEKLQSAMKRLSKEEQEAIRLFFFEGMNHEAIARTQMWSLRTCKRRVNDAVHKVALMLFGKRSKQTVAFV